jgi:hypothetical protein
MQVLQYKSNPFWWKGTTEYRMSCPIVLLVRCKVACKRLYVGTVAAIGGSPGSGNTKLEWSFGVHGRDKIPISTTIDHGRLRMFVVFLDSTLCQRKLVSLLLTSMKVACGTNVVHVDVWYTVYLQFAVVCSLVASSLSTNVFSINQSIKFGVQERTIDTFYYGVSRAGKLRSQVTGHIARLLPVGLT